MESPSPVDLLVFGPHPDDLEIGLGGTIALHAALGFRVGLCDLTRGELGSNGTPDEREAEAEAARAVLGASWRTNLRWPDGGIDGNEVQMIDVVRLVRTVRPRTVALPHSNDRHPDHRAASDVLTRAVFKSGLRRFARRGAVSLAPDWLCYYFINDSDPASFAVDVSEHYETKRQALACHRSQFTPSGPDSIETRLTAPHVPAADREPRRTPRRTHRGRLRRRGDRARSGPAPAPVQGLDARRDPQGIE